jgi:hypothetical protein
MAAKQKRETFKETAKSDAEREWLRDFVRFAMGDPKLDSWEANFMLSVRAMTEPGGPLPSAKQTEIIQRIAAELGYGKTDNPASPAEDDGPDADGYRDC